MREQSMTRRSAVVTRRRLLVDLGRVTLGAVVLGTAVVACSDSDAANTGASPTDAGAATGSGASPAATEAPGASGTEASAPTPSSDGGTTATRWARVDLGFVSAYVVAEGGELAIIDTGVAGSERDIEAVIEELGGRWSDVGHVILTHRHPDHAGSVEAVLEAAADATAYAGAGDISAIASPRPITAVGDGDHVMDLEVIDTPGHTAGHISVLDPTGSVLFAGDALNGDGGVAGPNASFTEDLDTAWASVRKLGERTFDTAAFGHGAPLVGHASVEVAALQGP